MIMRRDNRLPLYIAVGVISGFLIGFLWQYIQASNTRADLARVEHELTFQQLEAELGAAAVEAWRGGYETARQLASNFFSGLQQEIGRAPADARPVLDDILQRRDVMITALSRNDPQSAPLLGQLLVGYRTAFGRVVAPGPGTQPAPPPEPADSPAA
jgi:hypothetical protein